GSRTLGRLARRRCRGPRIKDGRTRGGQPVARLPADRAVLAGQRVRPAGGAAGVWLRRRTVIGLTPGGGWPVAAARRPGQERVERTDGVLHSARDGVPGSG